MTISLTFILPGNHFLVTLYLKCTHLDHLYSEIQFMEIFQKMASSNFISDILLVSVGVLDRR